MKFFELREKKFEKFFFGEKEQNKKKEENVYFFFIYFNIQKTQKMKSFSLRKKEQLFLFSYSRQCEN